MSEQVYLALLSTLLESGKARSDRTGVGTRSLFGAQLRFDLRDGFPLLTTKRVHFKSVVHELLWFLRGETNIGSLREAGVSIWDEWADASGELGPVYGKQWRRWSAPDGREIDQIALLLNQIRERPDSRRLLVSAWNPADVERMALPPCHTLFQFYVHERELSCQLYQRSADVFLGVPFNIASYALLTHLVAHACALEPAEFILTLGDAHLYENHLEQAALQLTREPLPPPTLTVHGELADLSDVKPEQITLSAYQHHPAIRAPVAV